MQLDDPSTYKTIDPTGMGNMIASLAEQCQAAWTTSRVLPLPRSYKNLDRAIIIGMGGSAIAGELVSDLQQFEGASPPIIVQDYTPPSEIDDRTLVIASSHSGNTAETLAAFEQALERGGRGIAVTTGGKLEAMAKSRELPLIKIGALGPPRTSIGWGICSILAVLQQAKLAPDRSQELVHTFHEIRELCEVLGPNMPEKHNPAKLIARSIGENHMVMIFGAGHLKGVARRWRTQIAENAKSWAFHDVLPEANHNTVEGFGLPKTAVKDMFVVLLRSTLFSAQISNRVRLTSELLEKYGILYEDPLAQSESALSQILNTVLLGDFVSYYLAVIRNVDPAINPNLDWIKRRITRD